MQVPADRRLQLLRCHRPHRRTLLWFPSLVAAVVVVVLLCPLEKRRIPKVSQARFAPRFTVF